MSNNNNSHDNPNNTTPTTSTDAEDDTTLTLLGLTGLLVNTNASNNNNNTSTTTNNNNNNAHRWRVFVRVFTSETGMMQQSAPSLPLQCVAQPHRTWQRYVAHWKVANANNNNNSSSGSNSTANSNNTAVFPVPSAGHLQIQVFLKFPSGRSLKLGTCQGEIPSNTNNDNNVNNNVTLEWPVVLQPPGDDLVQTEDAVLNLQVTRSRRRASSDVVVEDNDALIVPTSTSNDSITSTTSSSHHNTTTTDARSTSRPFHVRSASRGDAQLSAPPSRPSWRTRAAEHSSDGAEESSTVSVSSSAVSAASSSFLASNKPLPPKRQGSWSTGSSSSTNNNGVTKPAFRRSVSSSSSHKPSWVAAAEGSSKAAALRPAPPKRPSWVKPAPGEQQDDSAVLRPTTKRPSWVKPSSSEAGSSKPPPPRQQHVPSWVKPAHNDDDNNETPSSKVKQRPPQQQRPSWVKPTQEEQEAAATPVTAAPQPKRPSWAKPIVPSEPVTAPARPPTKRPSWAKASSDEHQDTVVAATPRPPPTTKRPSWAKRSVSAPDTTAPNATTTGTTSTTATTTTNNNDDDSKDDNASTARPDDNDAAAGGPSPQDDNDAAVSEVASTASQRWPRPSPQDDNDAAASEVASTTVSRSNRWPRASSQDDNDAAASEVASTTVSRSNRWPRPRPQDDNDAAASEVASTTVSRSNRWHRASPQDDDVASEVASAASRSHRPLDLQQPQDDSASEVRSETASQVASRSRWARPQPPDDGVASTASSSRARRPQHEDEASEASAATSRHNRLVAAASQVSTNSRFLNRWSRPSAETASEAASGVSTSSRRSHNNRPDLDNEPGATSWPTTVAPLTIDSLRRAETAGSEVSASGGRGWGSEAGSATSSRHRPSVNTEWPTATTEPHGVDWDDTTSDFILQPKIVEEESFAFSGGDYARPRREADERSPPSDGSGRPVVAPVPPKRSNGGGSPRTPGNYQPSRTSRYLHLQQQRSEAEAKPPDMSENVGSRASPGRYFTRRPESLPQRSVEESKSAVSSNASSYQQPITTLALGTFEVADDPKDGRSDDEGEDMPKVTSVSFSPKSKPTAENVPPQPSFSERVEPPYRKRTPLTDSLEPGGLSPPRSAVSDARQSANNTSSQPREVSPAPPSPGFSPPVSNLPFRGTLGAQSPHRYWNSQSPSAESPSPVRWIVPASPAKLSDSPVAVPTKATPAMPHLYSPVSPFKPLEPSTPVPTSSQLKPRPAAATAQHFQSVSSSPFKSEISEISGIANSPKQDLPRQPVSLSSSTLVSSSPFKSTSSSPFTSNSQSQKLNNKSIQSTPVSSSPFKAADASKTQPVVDPILSRVSPVSNSPFKTTPSIPSKSSKMARKPTSSFKFSASRHKAFHSLPSNSSEESTTKSEPDTSKERKTQTSSPAVRNNLSPALRRLLEASAPQDTVKPAPPPPPKQDLKDLVSPSVSRSISTFTARSKSNFVDRSQVPPLGFRTTSRSSSHSDVTPSSRTAKYLASVMASVSAPNSPRSPDESRSEPGQPSVATQYSVAAQPGPSFHYDSTHPSTSTNTEAEPLEDPKQLEYPTSHPSHAEELPESSNTASQESSEYYSGQSQLSNSSQQHSVEQPSVEAESLAAHGILEGSRSNEAESRNLTTERNVIGAAPSNSLNSTAAESETSITSDPTKTYGFVPSSVSAPGSSNGVSVSPSFSLSVSSVATRNQSSIIGCSWISPSSSWATPPASRAASPFAIRHSSPINSGETGPGDYKLARDGPSENSPAVSLETSNEDAEDAVAKSEGLLLTLPEASVEAPTLAEDGRPAAKEGSSGPTTATTTEGPSTTEDFHGTATPEDFSRDTVVTGGRTSTLSDDVADSRAVPTGAITQSGLDATAQTTEFASHERLRKDVVPGPTYASKSETNDVWSIHRIPKPSNESFDSSQFDSMHQILSSIPTASEQEHTPERGLHIPKPSGTGRRNRSDRRAKLSKIQHSRRRSLPRLFRRGPENASRQETRTPAPTAMPTYRELESGEDSKHKKSWLKFARLRRRKKRGQNATESTVAESGVADPLDEGMATELEESDWKIESVLPFNENATKRQTEETIESVEESGDEVDRSVPTTPDTMETTNTEISPAWLTFSDSKTPQRKNSKKSKYAHAEHLVGKSYSVDEYGIAHPPEINRQYEDDFFESRIDKRLFPEEDSFDPMHEQGDHGNASLESQYQTREDGPWHEPLSTMGSDGTILENEAGGSAGQTFLQKSDLERSYFSSPDHGTHVNQEMRSPPRVSGASAELTEALRMRATPKRERTLRGRRNHGKPDERRTADSPMKLDSDVVSPIQDPDPAVDEEDSWVTFKGNGYTARLPRAAVLQSMHQQSTGDLGQKHPAILPRSFSDELLLNRSSPAGSRLESAASHGVVVGEVGTSTPPIPPSAQIIGRSATEDEQQALDFSSGSDFEQRSRRLASPGDDHYTRQPEKQKPQLTTSGEPPSSASSSRVSSSRVLQYFSSQQESPLGFVPEGDELSHEQTENEGEDLQGHLDDTPMSSNEEKEFADPDLQSLESAENSKENVNQEMEADADNGGDEEADADNGGDEEADADNGGDEEAKAGYEPPQSESFGSKEFVSSSEEKQDDKSAPVYQNFHRVPTPPTVFGIAMPAGASCVADSVDMLTESRGGAWIDFHGEGDDAGKNFFANACRAPNQEDHVPSPTNMTAPRRDRQEGMTLHAEGLSSLIDWSVRPMSEQTSDGTDEGENQVVYPSKSGAFQSYRPPPPAVKAQQKAATQIVPDPLDRPNRMSSRTATKTIPASPSSVSSFPTLVQSKRSRAFRSSSASIYSQPPAKDKPARKGRWSSNSIIAAITNVIRCGMVAEKDFASPENSFDDGVAFHSIGGSSSVASKSLESIRKDGRAGNNPNSRYSPAISEVDELSWAVKNSRWI